MIYIYPHTPYLVMAISKVAHPPLEGKMSDLLLSYIRASNVG